MVGVQSYHETLGAMYARQADELRFVFEASTRAFDRSMAPDRGGRADLAVANATVHEVIAQQDRERSALRGAA